MAEGLQLEPITAEQLVVRTKEDAEALCQLLVFRGVSYRQAGGRLQLFLLPVEATIGWVERTARLLGCVPHHWESKEPEEWGGFMLTGAPGLAEPPNTTKLLEALRKQLRENGASTAAPVLLCMGSASLLVLCTLPLQPCTHALHECKLRARCPQSISPWPPRRATRLPSCGARARSCRGASRR